MKDSEPVTPAASLPSPAPDRSPPVPAAATSGPTSQQRDGLIHRYQERALERADPLQANLEMLCGDLMGFAGQIRASVEAELPLALSAADRDRILSARIEMHLRVARQVERFAQLAREQSAASPAP